MDEEVLEIIHSCYEEIKKLLQEHRMKLDQMAETLLQKETIDEKDVNAILGPHVT